MIEKVSVANINHTPKRDSYAQNQPSFKGGILDAPIWLLQQCEKYPMVNVTALDLSTAIIPRTIIETKESNGYAGFEAFRRESSGLIVNCIIPSFIVMGAAALLQKPIMKGFGKFNLANVWANEDSLKVVEKYLAQAKGTGAERLENALTAFMNDLSGVDANKCKRFTDFDLKGAIKKISKSAYTDHPSKEFKTGYKDIVNKTCMAEHLKLDGKNTFLSKNLEGILSDFVSINKAIDKEGIKTAEQLSKYISKAIKLVNVKSIAGLGLIIPLAISMQPLNRWITRKNSGQKGAPIYKDFGQNNQHKEMSTKEKRELLAQKFISIGSMLGVCGLSMFLDRPSLKNILQFKGLFPTMDQARIISTATFASRMAASEDKNELREATVRDIATFSSFYFLGDYVAKGIATLLEKTNKGVKLVNVLKPLDKDANALQKFWHWAKHTAIKSSDELSSVKYKNLAYICQIGNILFSLASLGVFIPFYTRSKTNKKHAQELARLNAEKTDSKNTDFNFNNTIVKNAPAFKNFLNS